MRAAFDLAVYRFAEIKPVYAVHAASDEKAGMAFRAVFLYLFCHGFLYAVCFLRYGTALHEKNLCGQYLEQNGGAARLFQYGKGSFGAVHGKSDGKRESCGMRGHDHGSAYMLCADVKLFDAVFSDYGGKEGRNRGGAGL